MALGANGAVTLSRLPDGATAHVPPSMAADGDKVEFARKGVRGLEPDGSVGLISTTARITRRSANNALTGAQEVSKQDTGTDGIKITHTFKCTSLAADSAWARLAAWASEDNAPTTITRRGRISQDDKAAPALNVTASESAGLKIEDLSLDIDRGTNEHKATLVLVLDGDPSALGG